MEFSDRQMPVKFLRFGRVPDQTKQNPVSSPLGFRVLGFGFRV